MQKSTAQEIDSTTPDMVSENIAQLKAVFPSAFSEGKVDIDKLRLLLGDAVDTRAERYSFTWAGKRDAVQMLQTPSQATLNPAPEESVSFDETANLFLEGENLEVLKLLHKSYFGSVKLIYIDPPYNTGNEFVYPDDFAEPLARYLALTGQRDEQGNLLTSNPETSGRYHSAWLSMMYPRLFLARQLLREDGVIFVSIDDHEVHNLRMLMNEIFGEENFLGTIVWQRKYGPANDAKQISQTHEYLLVYARSAATWVPELLARDEEQLAAFKNPDNDPRGPWRASDLSARTASESAMYPITTPTGRVTLPPPSRSWIVSKQRFEELLADNRIWFGVDGNGRPMQKKFLTEVKQGITPQTWWDREFAGDNKIARYEMKELFPENLFDTPKPVSLMKRVLGIGTSPQGNDLVLDFFAGSCTMAQAVLELNREDDGNRRFIMVQLPEPTGKSEYPTIADLGKERIRRVIAQLRKEDVGKLDLPTRKTPEDLGFRVFKLSESNLRQWRTLYGSDADAYLDQMGLFTDQLLPGKQLNHAIWEIALREGYDLNATIAGVDGMRDNAVYQVTDPDKRQSFYVCLDDRIRLEALRPLALSADDLFVCRDSAVDDTAAANLALQCRLKTI